MATRQALGVAVNVTAADAKNRLGQLLDQAQRQPVFIEKAPRRHSVVTSVKHCEALLKASQAGSATTSKQFYQRYKAWVDEQNRHFDERGLWNDELRVS
jgi:hypothetical protein